MDECGKSRPRPTSIPGPSGPWRIAVLPMLPQPTGNDGIIIIIIIIIITIITNVLDYRAMQQKLSSSRNSLVNSCAHGKIHGAGRSEHNNREQALDH